MGLGGAMNLSFPTHHRFAVITGLVGVLLYMLPYLVMGERAYVQILDNLDSVFVTAKVLVDSHKIFSPSSDIIPQFDVPRLCFGSEFSLPLYLMMVMSPFAAFVVNGLFIKIIAFLSMYLLLARHVIPKEQPLMLAGVSLAFACLPVFPFAELSIAGLPLALYAFLNIRQGGDRPYDWAILVVLPFFSSLIYSFFFFLFFMGLVFVHDLVVRPYPTLKRFLLALVLMSVVFLLVEYRLVLNSLDPLFVTHRTEFAPDYLSLKGALSKGFKNFVSGQYHAPSLHSVIILPFMMLILTMVPFRGGLKDRATLKLGLVFTLCALISLFYGLWYSEMVRPVREQFPMLEEINFSRFHWIHPLLWFIGFALALDLFRRYAPLPEKIRTGVMALSILGQIVWVGVIHHEILVAKHKEGVTFQGFFAEALFNDIKQDIGQPVSSYRVVSLGFPASVPAYNGFMTADYYLAYYPLDKKHQFREVIAGELQRNPFLRKKYDDWGNRMYLFNSGTAYDFLGKEHTAPIDHLYINTHVLRALGVRYIFSRVPIVHGFKLMRVYTSSESQWEIYVYEL